MLLKRFVSRQDQPKTIASLIEGRRGGRKHHAIFWLLYLLYVSTILMLPFWMTECSQKDVDLMPDGPTATANSALVPGTKSWPLKLGTCTAGGWPFEIILSAEDAPLQMFTFEVEKTEDDRLAMLIGAVSYEKGFSTKDLLLKVVPSLRCDYRRGSERENAQQGPVHRAHVDLNILSEGKIRGDIAAKITCDLPPVSVLKEVDGSQDSRGPLHQSLRLPTALEVLEMDGKRRAQEETYNWLHLQFSLPDLQSDTDTKAGKSWISSPSVPICDTTSTRPNKSSSSNPPSTDDYRPRGDEVNEDSSDAVSVALCVAPTTSTSNLKFWRSSSIDEWVYYQSNVIGFSTVFYLDPFGEELALQQGLSLLPPPLGSGLVHVPHVAVRNSFQNPLSEGPVAAALVRERCSMLARQQNIDYIFVVADPMDLLVPLQRQAQLLPKVLASVVGKGGCARSLQVQVTPIAWSLREGDTEDPTIDEDTCDEAWCSLPDAADFVSRFLLAGRPAFAHEANSSGLSFWHTSTSTYPSIHAPSCKTIAFLPDDLFRMLRLLGEDSSPDDIQGEHKKVKKLKTKSLGGIVQNVGTWVRQILQTRAINKERSLGIIRRLESNPSWIPVSGMRLRSCRTFGDKGPQYGEAIVLKRNSSTAVMRLSFYNAETIVSPITGNAALSISVYAEDIGSIDYSLYQGWGKVFQSRHVLDILPDVSCNFFHHDPMKRVLSIPQELHTKGQWKRYGNKYKDYFWWLECPFPDELPSPDAEGTVSLVTIEPAGTASFPSNLEFHMIRPVQLCMGAERKGSSCDFSSVACRVGCIDDLKNETDPTAQCCSRCHEQQHSYQRFDERDFWTPELSSIYSEEVAVTDQASSQPPSQNAASLRSGDLSLCLKPLYTETLSREKDNIDSFSPRRVVEWLEYHLLIGFDVIYVFDRFGKSLLPLLEPYVRAGRVIHVPFPLLSDTPLTSEARGNQTKFKPGVFEHMLAYDYCLSIARRRGDFFTAFTDLDEFVRYPEAEAGRLRAVIWEVLNDAWTNQTDLPDQIYLDRYDVESDTDGFALRHTVRFLHPRVEWKEKGKDLVPVRHGKVLANPHALVYGGVTVHQAVRADKRPVTSIDGGDALSIFHYRPYNEEKEADAMQKSEKAVDRSLQWAHDILSVQFVGSSGWATMRTLSRQGLLRLKSMPRRTRIDTVPITTVVASSPDTRPVLLIGILSYCATRDRRDAIRQTWLSKEVLEAVESAILVQWKFILGQAPISELSASCQEDALSEEQGQFGDLLFLQDLPENYQVLTRKTLAMFRWANDNVDADFVLKTDDDSYINLLNFASDLEQIESSDVPLYWGNHQRLDRWLSADFESFPKWYIKPEDFPLDTQTYATGAGYLLSRPLVRHLASMLGRHEDALQLPWGPEDRMGWLEDASVGYLLRGAVTRAGRVKAAGIQDTWFKIWCEPENFVIHHLNASQQFDLHPLLFTRQGYASVDCEQLSRFDVDPPRGKIGERAEAVQWGGSFLDRIVSPLVIAAPPRFTLPYMSGESAITMSNGRDVIVVTGGLHNIGCHLVEKLQQGYSRMSGPLTILVIDSAAERDNKGTLNHMGVQTVVKNVDITNFEALFGALAGYMRRIRGVVHLAAISRVQDCHSNKARCREVNVGGTKNILNVLWNLYGRHPTVADSTLASDRSPLPWLVFASSREVFGGLGADDVATETSTFDPLNIYGKTKLQAEEIIRRWTIKTGFNSVIVRFVNVYGSCHDHTQRLVPNLLTTLASNEPFSIFGSADKTISFLHVQDAVQSLILSTGYADSLQNGAGYFEPFNIGGGPEHDVLNMEDIVSAAQTSVLAAFPECKFCRHSSESRVLRGEITKERSTEPDHFRTSIDKAFRVLGFHPSRSFDVDSLSEFLQRCVVPNLDRLLVIAANDCKARQSNELQAKGWKQNVQDTPAHANAEEADGRRVAGW